MNIFATIHAIDTFNFKKVKYYSIQFENREEIEFIDFLNRMEDIDEIKEDLNKLFIWLEEIGENVGALPHFFRHEGQYSEASALPPPRKEMTTQEIVVEEKLRLYCLRANEHVVFLFNGGLKTTGRAQDCPNVSTYFNQANRLSNAIDRLFSDKEISWNSQQTDILFNSDLEIEI